MEREQSNVPKEEPLDYNIFKGKKKQFFLQIEWNKGQNIFFLQMQSYFFSLSARKKDLSEAKPFLEHCKKKRECTKARSLAEKMVWTALNQWREAKKERVNKKMGC